MSLKCFSGYTWKTACLGAFLSFLSMSHWEAGQGSTNSGQGEAVLPVVSVPFYLLFSSHVRRMDKILLLSESRIQPHPHLPRWSGSLEVSLCHQGAVTFTDGVLPWCSINLPLLASLRLPWFNEHWAVKSPFHPGSVNCFVYNPINFFIVLKLRSLDRWLLLNTQCFTGDIQGDRRLRYMTHKT